MWVRGLRERLQEPMQKLLAMDRSVLELPAFAAAEQKYEGVMAELAQYEAALVADWCQQVASTTDAKLNQPLLRFREDATPELQLLAVNFDPALVRLLKETKYFLLLQIQARLRWCVCVCVSVAVGALRQQQLP
jgi:dynein heavy chain